MRWIQIIVSTILWIDLSGCAPANVRALDEPHNAVQGNTSAQSGLSISNGRTSAKTREQQPVFYTLAPNSYRVHMDKNEVWEAMVDTLMRSYNLTVVDKDAGVLTTEWDTFALNQNVYRNKISVRVRPIGRRVVDLTIHNNVEKLGDSTHDYGAAGVWLPAEDVAKEVDRLVQNAAIVLNVPPPKSETATALKEGVNGLR